MGLWREFNAAITCHRVQIEAWDFRPKKITIQSNAVTALIIVHARIRVELEKLGDI